MLSFARRLFASEPDFDLRDNSVFFAPPTHKFINHVSSSEMSLKSTRKLHHIIDLTSPCTIYDAANSDSSRFVANNIYILSGIIDRGTHAGGLTSNSLIVSFTLPFLPPRVPFLIRIMADGTFRTAFLLEPRHFPLSPSLE